MTINTEIRLLERQLREIQEMIPGAPGPWSKYDEMIQMAVSSLKLTKIQRKHWEEVVEQLWHENRTLYFDMLQLTEYVASLKKDGITPPANIEAVLHKNKDSYDKAYGISVDLPPEEEEDQP